MAKEPSGSTVGHWRLGQTLGEGSYGLVYEATHLSIVGRTAAVKVLHRHLAADPVAKRRFLQEASAASLASHESIVQVFDSGITEDGACYIVMERLQGIPMAALLAGGRMAVGRAVRLLGQVACALAAAHKAGVIHRDLKPENILVLDPDSENERIKVLDFGVAKLQGVGDLRTSTGTWMGTAPYMSPEQWQSVEDIDGRADIYSLGIILYQCLAGTLPFRARSQYEWLRSHLEQPAPGIPADVAAPRPLVYLAQRMLEKERDRRPQTMDEVVQAFQEAHHALAIPASTEALLKGGSRSNIWIVLSGSLAILSLGSSSILLYRRARPSRTVSRETPSSQAALSAPRPAKPAVAVPPDMAEMGRFAVARDTVRINEFREYWGTTNKGAEYPLWKGADLDRYSDRQANLVSFEEAGRYCAWKYRPWNGRIPTAEELETAVRRSRANSGNTPEWTSTHCLPSGALCGAQPERNRLHVSVAETRPSGPQHEETDCACAGRPDPYISFRCAVDLPVH